MKRLSINESIQIAKIGSDWIPHNHNLSKIDKKQYLCPVCKTQDETTSHMIECTLKHNPDLLQTYEKNELKHGTDPRIVRCILHLLRKDTTAKQLKHKYASDQHIINAISQQQNLGYKLLFHGKITKTWSDIQQEYHKYHNNYTFNSNWPLVY